MSQILNDYFSQMKDALILSGRATANEEKLLGKGPYLAGEALEKGLVDELFYKDEVIEAFKKECGGDLFYFHKYRARIKKKKMKNLLKEGSRSRVALVYGVGPVKRGRKSEFSFGDDPEMRSEDVVRALRQARLDDRVKGVLFRIDSPGGSYVASDTIWKEVLSLKEAGKPVIASMGNIAGSGGYFVAMPATKIVAQPGTLTGSIGVITAKMDTRDFWEQLGIIWQGEEVGENASLWDGTSPMNRKQKERMNHYLDVIYGDFVTKAAKSRNMSEKDMHAIAKGRVWSGQRALELGLIDALGGFETSFALLRESLKLPENAPLEVRVYPPKRNFLEQLLGDEANNSQEAAEPAFELRLPRIFQKSLTFWKRLFRKTEVLTMFPPLQK
jgi:protease-4